MTPAIYNQFCKSFINTKELHKDNTVRVKKITREHIFGILIENLLRTDWYIGIGIYAG